MFVGDEVIGAVNMNPTVKGIVRLNIGSKSYDVVVNRGVGTFAISDLEMGTYDVQAIFDGDNKYLGNSSDVKQLEVNRIPTGLAVSIDNPSIFVGDSVVVGVVLNQTINNVVIVNVNDKDYLIGIVNGKGNLTLSGLTFGTYTVNATFTGNDNYTANSTIQKLTIAEKVQQHVSEQPAESSSSSGGDKLHYDEEVNVYYNDEGVIVDPDGKHSQGVGSSYADVRDARDRWERGEPVMV
jgi:hypothetical protein